MTFTEWLNTAARKGDKFVYYTGVSLVEDAHKSPSTVGVIRNEVWKAIQMGLVTSVQRITDTDRHGRRLFEYIAVRGSFNPPLPFHRGTHVSAADRRDYFRTYYERRAAAGR